VTSRRKPTVAELGVDIAAMNWQRSGAGDGSFEVAFVGGSPGAEVRWVLLRVSGDPAGRILVYDRVEWLCFLDGARGGEFDTGRACRGGPGPAPH
jgi:hypothetical protein